LHFRHAIRQFPNEEQQLEQLEQLQQAKEAFLRATQKQKQNIKKHRKTPGGIKYKGLNF
jgi:hypothetical protein